MDADPVAAHGRHDPRGGGTIGLRGLGRAIERIAGTGGRVPGRFVADRLVSQRDATGEFTVTSVSAVRAETTELSSTLSPTGAATLTADSPDRFINREVSWLDFNHRVVEEAENARHPLLERLRFLSISASNLDEFFSVRVAGLIGQAKAGVAAISADGRTAGEQLEAIQTRAQLLIGAQQRVWRELRGQLAEAGVELVETSSL
ncbi:MAG: hypothetical protein EOO78_28090, partial [Oxalobacteraceae bacterium]